MPKSNAMLKSTAASKSPAPGSNASPTSACLSSRANAGLPPPSPPSFSPCVPTGPTSGVLLSFNLEGLEVARSIPRYAPIVRFVDAIPRVDGANAFVVNLLRASPSAGPGSAARRKTARKAAGEHIDGEDGSAGSHETLRTPVLSSFHSLLKHRLYAFRASPGCTKP